MKTLHALRTVFACALLCASASSFAAISLTPVVSGLSSPLFVGHAGDGSNRLFIEEQAGIIKVLQPGASTPTVFLDIRSKIVSGGERGLLGLAFHPQYSSNGRFFVYYTRIDDGALVIAEYGVSANPNIASTTEKVLLTIPHPTNTNHNGGMLAFSGKVGEDHYLYIGVGDGGSGNDPPNNAQNIDQLLGKILRIDVSTSGVYSSPSANPYVGVAGRDEIFSIGWRNPWRFSFDRLTHQLWVADVGQGAREEVDANVMLGGNYGWRVYEGTACTGNDPSLCNPANYIAPLFDYMHSQIPQRCSITGGYVYRGAQGAFPAGTYVYGDYCSGEIFSWNGSTQSVVVDTAMNISSFGEDQAGELYVVDLNGTVSKIASTTPPPPPTCTYSISPTRVPYPSSGGIGNVTVSATAGCAWTATSNASWITIPAGAGGSGNGSVNYSVAAYTGKPKKRNGTATIAGQTLSISQTR